MTVAELITQLSELPPDWPVYVRGYGGGVNDVGAAKPARFIRDADDIHIWGQHERAWPGSEAGQRPPNGVELTGENLLARAAREKIWTAALGVRTGIELAAGAVVDGASDGGEHEHHGGGHGQPQDGFDQ